MPLELEAHRPDAVARIREALRHLRARPVGLPPPLANGPLADLATGVPHGVYDLGVADLAAGKGLEAARRTAWRCLVLHESGPLASAELHDDGTDAVLTVGPFAAAMDAVIRVAEALPIAGLFPFELRFLRISALHLGAIWLKGTGDRPDLVLPLPPAPRGLEPARPYAEGELIPVLNEMAIRKSKHVYHP